MNEAKALWIESAGQAVLRGVAVVPEGEEVAVQTLFTGISRGTERLVFNGQVPASEHDTMRAPFQEGAFSFPVKYGYSAVGRVESGAMTGEIVFALYPHQARFACAPEALTPVPDEVPPARAVLAANMETALNITWDAGVGIGDRVVVVGCGVVGALAAYLCARVPGTEVTLVDVDPSKAALARALGCGFAAPGEVGGEADLVIHASASGSGLATAIDAAGTEATVVEASWYGAGMVEAPLGGRFHQRRLRLISSQVGRLPAHQVARWDYRRRLSVALGLLADPALDALISGETAFDALADCYATILSDPATLCHRVRYSD